MVGGGVGLLDGCLSPLPLCFTNGNVKMLHEDEGRKLVKDSHILTLMRVFSAIAREFEAGGKTDAQMQARMNWIHTLISKIRYKKYVMTKKDMQFVNECYLSVRGK